MIRWSEVIEALEKINEGFVQHKNVESRIRYLHQRLNDEVKTAYTDIDLILIQLKSNIDTYLKTTDLNTPEASELFGIEVVNMFLKDMTGLGIKQLSSLIDRLRELKWK